MYLLDPETDRTANVLGTPTFLTAPAYFVRNLELSAESEDSLIHGLESARLLELELDLRAVNSATRTFLLNGGSSSDTTILSKSYKIPNRFIITETVGSTEIPIFDGFQELRQGNEFEIQLDLDSISIKVFSVERSVFERIGIEQLTLTETLFTGEFIEYYYSSSFYNMHNADSSYSYYYSTLVNFLESIETTGTTMLVALTGVSGISFNFNYSPSIATWAGSYRNLLPTFYKKDGSTTATPLILTRILDGTDIIGGALSDINSKSIRNTTKTVYDLIKSFAESFACQIQTYPNKDLNVDYDHTTDIEIGIDYIGFIDRINNRYKITKNGTSTITPGSSQSQFNRIRVGDTVFPQSSLTAYTVSSVTSSSITLNSSLSGSGTINAWIIRKLTLSDLYSIKITTAENTISEAVVNIDFKQHKDLEIYKEVKDGILNENSYEIEILFSNTQTYPYLHLWLDTYFSILDERGIWYDSTTEVANTLTKTSPKVSLSAGTNTYNSPHLTLPTTISDYIKGSDKAITGYVLDSLKLSGLPRILAKLYTDVYDISLLKLEIETKDIFEISDIWTPFVLDLTSYGFNNITFYVTKIEKNGNTDIIEAIAGKGINSWV